MIQEAIAFQKRELQEQIESHTANLVRGTASRDEDQRVRGIIFGMKLALGVIADLEDRLRKAEGQE